MSDRAAKRRPIFRAVRERGDPGQDGRDAGEQQQARDLLRLVVDGVGSLWDWVHAPFIRRELPKGVVRHLIALGHREAGGSYKLLARHLRIEAQHKKLLDFVRISKLSVRG